MKTTLFTPALWLGFAALAASASAQDAAPARALAPAPDTSILPSARAANQSGGLRFNFRGAPL